MIDPQPTETDEAQASEPRTFDELYLRHHRDVLRYASLMLGDPDEGADVAADAFAAAFDAWRDGRGPTGRALPWILLITRRRVFDRWRRRRRIRWLPLPHLETAAAPDDRVRTEFWLWLGRLAAALPQRQREVIFLRYRRDLSDADIAAVMGLTESGVRSLAARAIEALRQHPDLST